MRIKRADFNRIWMAISMIVAMKSVMTAEATVISYWRMESQVNLACFGSKGVVDSATNSGQGTLTGNCGSPAAEDSLITFNGNGDTVSISSTVPPAGMFNSGFSGGVGSYNAEAITNVNGALFFPQDRYGDEFTNSTWTVELFFKANGNQSGNGQQELLKNDEFNFNYGLILNEPSGGNLRLAVYDGSTFPVVDLADRNYADGQWHYVVCSYSAATKTLSIRVRSENGYVSRNSVTLTSNPVAGPAGNLFIGRNDFSVTASPRTFRGLIDEVRISDSVVADSALVGKINPDGANVVAHWKFESILNSGSATNWARFQDYATATNQGTAVGSGGATPSQDYLNIYPGDTGVVISNVVPPVSMFSAGFNGGTNSYYCQGSTAAAVFDPARFGDECNTVSWTIEAFYKANGNQSAAPDPDSNRMQLLRNGDWFYGLVANEASAGSLRLFAQQTDGQFKFADLTDRNYSDGTWQYVVCTYDQPVKKLTIRVRSENGLVSSNSVTLTADPKNTALPFYIGAVDSGGARRVRGWMDEVRFSDNVQPDIALMGLIGADASNLLSSSSNPAVLGSSITFTSRVNAAVVGNGTPTGSVQFKTNGVNWGGPVSLASGVATISTSLLPVGSHLIRAEYSGDGKFYGSTNTLTQVVNKGNSTSLLASSQNPSLPGSNVNFTATVSAVAPTTNTPSGNVVFLMSGTPFSTNILSGGMASVSIATLLHGSNVIAVQFAGDGNLNGSTNSLVQIVNRPPTAQNLTFGASYGQSGALAVVGGKHAPSDPDGDMLTITAVGPASSGVAGFTSSNITYVANGTLGTNTFTYTVADEFGGTATATVTVNVSSGNSGQGFNQLSMDVLGGGDVRLTYLGIPGINYALDWRTNLSLGGWVPMVTNVTATNGFLIFTNNSAAPENYFRTRYVP